MPPWPPTPKPPTPTPTPTVPGVPGGAGRLTVMMGMVGSSSREGRGRFEGTMRLGSGGSVSGWINASTRVIGGVVVQVVSGGGTGEVNMGGNGG